MPRKTVWTEGQDTQIRRLRTEGASWDVIARHSASHAGRSSNAAALWASSGRRPTPSPSWTSPIARRFPPAMRKAGAPSIAAPAWRTSVPDAWHDSLSPRPPFSTIPPEGPDHDVPQQPRRHGDPEISRSSAQRPKAMRSMRTTSSIALRKPARRCSLCRHRIFNPPSHVVAGVRAHGAGDLWLDRGPYSAGGSSADKITRMDEAMSWIPLIPLDRHVLRRVVGARSLVHPITDRHLFAWRRLGKALGADHKAVQRWHAQAIAMIVAALNAAA